MKTLYLSDLDGTLLRSNERVSEYTANTVNRFVKAGGFFSYATARSIVTASKVTDGLNAEFPVICCNGAFIVRSTTCEVLLANYFTADEVEFAAEILTAHHIYPIINAYIGGVERLTYITQNVSSAMRSYLDNRVGDPRRREVESVDELYAGDIFRFTCMEEEDALRPIGTIFGSDNRFSCICQKEVYSGTCWCDILPAKATKANAALKLKAMLGCDKLVAFGDGRNDMSLFSVADEKYAVSNAVPELKEIATAVIDSNDHNGVAKWMERHAF